MTWQPDPVVLVDPQVDPPAARGHRQAWVRADQWALEVRWVPVVTAWAQTARPCTWVPWGQWAVRWADRWGQEGRWDPWDPEVLIRPTA